MNRVTLYDGGETTGSVADRKIYSSARKETTGSVGVRPAQTTETVNVDKTPECDTVCFRGREGENKKGISFMGGLMMTIGAAGLIIGGLGCAHKYNTLGKLSDGKIKDFLLKSEPALKTCYEWCAKSKGYARQGYDKVASFFKKK